MSASEIFSGEVTSKRLRTGPLLGIRTTRALAYILLGWSLTVGVARPSASAQVCEVPEHAPVGALFELWQRCPYLQAEIEGAVRTRGELVVPELVHVFETRPEVRLGVVRSLARMGEAGRAGLRELGTEGLYVLAKEGPAHDDVAAALPALGPRALDTLFQMLLDPNREVRIFAASALRLFGPDALDGLLVAMEANPDPDVRRMCGQAAAHIDAPKSLPGLLRRLREPGLAQSERKGTASLLVAIDDPAALAALVRLLRDPAVERWVRWDIAQQMKQSGRPAVVAAAREYGPAGRQGTGIPETSWSNVLAVALLAGVIGMVARCPGPLRRGERARLLAGGTVAVYLAASVALLIYTIMVVGLDASPVWLVAAVLAVVWGGSAFGVAIAKGADLPYAYVPIVATGSFLGFLGGFTLDRSMNWHLERVSTRLLGFYESPLVLGVTLAGALAASYLVRPPRTVAPLENP